MVDSLIHIRGKTFYLETLRWCIRGRGNLVNWGVFTTLIMLLRGVITLGIFIKY